MSRSLEVFKIVAHPVPRGFHLYLWLTYRTGRGRALGIGIEPLSEPPRGLRVLVGVGEHPRFVVDITT